LVPTSITITFGLACGPASGAPTVFIPDRFKIESNALAAGAKSATSAVGTNRVTPSLGATGIPAGGSPVERPQGGTLTQFAALRTLSNDIHKSRASGTLPATIPENCWPANAFNFSAISMICSGVNLRGALNFSNASWASRARVFASATAFCNAKFSVVCSVWSWPLLRQWRNPATDSPTTPIATNTPKTISQISSVLSERSSSTLPTAFPNVDDDSFFD
jgi:hypothetical protein